MTSIEYAIDPHQIATLTFNRPSVLNALDWDAMERFAQTIQSIGEEIPRVLILTGANGGFCAGGDLADLHPHSTEDDGRRLAALMGDALQALERFEFPTIAAIEGAAVGGGAEIAVACDLRIMADDAVLQMAQIRLGIMPGWGGGQRLLKLVGYSRAFYWLASGKRIDAQQALSCGLANETAPPGQAYHQAHSLAMKLSQFNPKALRATKTALLAGLDLTPGEALAKESSLFPPLWASPAHHAAAKTLIKRLRNDSE
jgi:enoyl-CoA hydratase/carnithine racemase